MPELGDFEALPDDVSVYIFSFLDPSALISLGQTCSKGNSLQRILQIQREKTELGRKLRGVELQKQKVGKRVYVKVPLGWFTCEEARTEFKKRLKSSEGAAGVILVNPNEPLSEFRLDRAILDATIMINHFLSRQRPDLLDTMWPVTVPEPSTWTAVNNRGMGRKTCSQDLMDFTEGITPPKGGRNTDETIYMNPNSYFTTGAIVHEMFHSLQHEDADDEWSGGGDNCEAMTELYAMLATGLDLRTTRSGGFIYPGARALLYAMQVKEEFTLEEMNQGYFDGNREKLSKIDAIRARYLQLFTKDDANSEKGIRAFLKQPDYRR